MANSLVVVEKAKAAYSHYNLRVVEGRLALALLGKALGVEDWRSLRTLWALEQALGAKTSPPGTPARLTDQSPHLFTYQHERSIIHPNQSSTIYTQAP